MGLLEDINSGKYNLVIIIIGLVLFFHLYLKQTNIETMADTNITDQIKEAVKQYYLADVESIRNLSEVATKLQAGGLAVPGNLIMKGPIFTDHNIAHPDINDGAIYRAEGQLTVASDDLIRFRSSTKKANTIEMNVNDGSINTSGPINSNGLISGTNLNVQNKIIVNSNIQGPNGQMRLSDQGIIFGGPNKDKETNSGQISAGLHIPNSLNIVGMSADNGHVSRRIDMWAEGGLNVNGQLFVNGRNILAELDRLNTRIVELDRLNARFPDNYTLDLTGGRMVYRDAHFHFVNPDSKGVKPIAFGGGSNGNWGGW
jgi:hypothetical protein